MEYQIRNVHTSSRLLVTILTVAVSCTCTTARRKDVVLMKNGDKLTGDVKRLENGVLYVETDYSSGSVPIDRLQVQAVHSIAGYQVTLSNGRHIAAQLKNCLRKTRRARTSR